MPLTWKDADMHMQWCLECHHQQYLHPTATMTKLAPGRESTFEQYVDPVYRFDRAEVIIALDSDFLDTGPSL